MYARDSRYRHQDEVVRIDAAGREQVVTALRRPSERPAAVRHVLEQGERLDHLGARYYRRSHRWWEICDANPGTLSPLHLVGQDPLRTATITVPLPAAPQPRPAWHAVLADLRAIPGVSGVSLTDVDTPLPGGDATPVPAVLITVELNVNSVGHRTLAESVLADTVAAHGLDPSVSTGVGAAGSAIAVPPPSGRT